MSSQLGILPSLKLWAMKVTILYNPVWIYHSFWSSVCFPALSRGKLLILHQFVSVITHLDLHQAIWQVREGLLSIQWKHCSLQAQLFLDSKIHVGMMSPYRKMIYRLNATINLLCNHNGWWLLWSNLSSYGDDEPAVYVFGGYGEVGSGRSRQMPASLYAATPAKCFHFCSSLMSSGFFSGFVLQPTRNKKKRKAIEEGKREAS